MSSSSSLSSSLGLHRAHCARLGLDASRAFHSAEDVTKAYRQMALAAHPDKPTGSAEAFRLLTAARDFLLAQSTGGGAAADAETAGLRRRPAAAAATSAASAAGSAASASSAAPPRFAKTPVHSFTAALADGSLYTFDIGPSAFGATGLRHGDVVLRLGPKDPKGEGTLGCLVGASSTGMVYWWRRGSPAATPFGPLVGPKAVPFARTKVGPTTPPQPTAAAAPQQQQPPSSPASSRARSAGASHAAPRGGASNQRNSVPLPRASGAAAKGNPTSSSSTGVEAAQPPSRPTEHVSGLDSRSGYGETVPPPPSHSAASPLSSSQGSPSYVPSECFSCSASPPSTPLPRAHHPSAHSGAVGKGEAREVAPRYTAPPPPAGGGDGQRRVLLIAAEQAARNALAAMVEAYYEQARWVWQLPAYSPVDRQYNTQYLAA